MMKRMMHPDPLQWGFAHSPGEEANMRAAGWVDDVPVEVEIVAVQAPEAEPEAPVKKKPGPKKKA